MKALIISFLVLISTSIVAIAQAQDYLQWDSHSVEGVYQKVDFKWGTVNDFGQPVTHVYSPIELDRGSFTATLKRPLLDVGADFLEITNTKYFLKFRSGRPSSGSGVLVVNGSNITFYKDPRG